MQGCDEPEPKTDTRVLCRHPFEEARRCYATPSRVESLLNIWWKDGKVILLSFLNVFQIYLFNSHTRSCQHWIRSGIKSEIQ